MLSINILQTICLHIYYQIDVIMFKFSRSYYKGIQSDPLFIMQTCRCYGLIVAIATTLHKIVKIIRKIVMTSSFRAIYVIIQKHVKFLDAFEMSDSLT